MSNHVASYGWSLWAIIAGMALVTYLNRAGLLLLSERFMLPPAWQKALRYAPASALAAIVTPDLMLNHGQFDLTFANTHFYAGAAGFGAAIVSRNTLAGIVAGMLVLHALQRLL
jgi:branched-subunit amino acid transport protein